MIPILLILAAALAVVVFGVALVAMAMLIAAMQQSEEATDHPDAELSAAEERNL